MQKLIYLEDSYKKSIDTHIVSIKPKGDHFEVILSETICYPEGGGQPSDKGTIVGKNGTLTITHARMHESDVIHEGKLTGTLEVGEKVSLMIDWDLRYKHMRVHSAGHILHEIVMKNLPYLKPLKGEHGKQAFIEYEGTINPKLKETLEKQTNMLIAEGKNITTEFVSFEELQTRAAWVPPKLPKNKPLRILQIDDFPAIPDGGTQVKNTSEVGEIKITGIEQGNSTAKVHYTLLEQKSPTEILSTAMRKTQTNLGEGLNIEAFSSLILEQQNELYQEIENTPSEELENLKIKYFGSSGSATQLIKHLKELPQEDRRQAGILVNEFKQSIDQAFTNKLANQKTTFSEWTDVTIPGTLPQLGHLHPTTLVIREMNDIFASLGFSVYDGPEIETDEYNYDRVNLPKDHPARDLQDTLYIKEPDVLLRTHTSSVESHILEDVKPPFRFVIPGKTYRYENANASNNSMFYQYEGMAVDKGISMAHLKGTLDLFVRKFFGEKRETRFRCKYYPQVEPGVGVDIDCIFCGKKGCTVCKFRGWIEMLGAGMVHPNMLRRVNLDPSVYSGFAWGMGLDRIVMQRYGIKDIRSLYNGDIGYK